MKSRSGLSIKALESLGQMSVGIMSSHLDDNLQFRSEVVSLLSCRLRFCPICNSDFKALHNCERGVAFGALSARNSVPGLSIALLRRVHQSVAPEMESRGTFRRGNVVVGAKVAATAFVSSKVDVEKHLKIYLPWFHRLPLEGRAGLVIYVMSILHPFEDGNGRVMRALLTMLAAPGEKGSAHLAFLALCVKLRQREMVRAVQWLCDGSMVEFAEFFRHAKKQFQSFESDFSSGSGRVACWVESQLDGSGESNFYF